jgi:non-heme chloroperoxidase
MNNPAHTSAEQVEEDKPVMTRRQVIAGGLALAGTSAVASRALASTFKTSKEHAEHGEKAMNIVTVKDGTEIYFKDWGTGQPIVFCHGWPLSADAWDAQMLFLSQQGFRVIAHDRRGHGRSGQPSNGNDMDTYADDLAALIEKLDLKKVVLVGHSTGGGEVARYIGRHGSKRVAKAVLISAVTPYMLQAESNPHGAPMSVFDGLRSGVAHNRSQFFKDLSMVFYGYNKPNAKASQGVLDSFWMQGMAASVKACYECIKAFSETDFREDLKKFDIPTLVLQGEDDQIVPLPLSSPITAKIVKNATLKTYPGLSHGLCTTDPETINGDLLNFIKA